MSYMRLETISHGMCETLGKVIDKLLLRDLLLEHLDLLLLISAPRSI
jgi:hypothetical protein